MTVASEPEQDAGEPPPRVPSGGPGDVAARAGAREEPEIEDAFRSQGLLIVREALSRDPRPTTIVMNSKGRLTYTP